jgi:hypothetical protein
MTATVTASHTRSGRPAAVHLYADEAQSREAVLSLVRLIDVGGWDELRTRVARMDDDEYGTSTAARDHARLQVDELIDELLAEQDALTSVVHITVAAHDVDGLISSMRAALEAKPGSGVRLTVHPGGAA